MELTKKQLAALKDLDTSDGQTRVIIIHDTGTHMNIIHEDGSTNAIDVDDFYQDESSGENLGEIIMDRLRY